MDVTYDVFYCFTRIFTIYNYPITNKFIIMSLRNIPKVAFNSIIRDKYQDTDYQIRTYFTNHSRKKTSAAQLSL